MIPISSSYINSICEVKTIKNERIAKATITEINDEYLEVTYCDEIHLLAPDTRVKISIMNEKLGFKVIVGKVYVGTNNFVRIVEVITLMDFEKRDFFRIIISENALMYKEKVSAYESNFTTKPSTNILINNISLCGAFFICKEKLNLEDKVYLLIELSRGKEIFPCVIKRITKNEDKSYGYGCQFLDQNQQQNDELYKYIFDKQIQYLKRNQD